MTMPAGLGAIIAVTVLVLAVVLIVIGQLPLFTGLLIAGCALSRLT